MTAKIRVVQCWDDGCPDDVRLCELLRKHGAKATFNLNPGLHRRDAQATPRDAAGRPTERLALAEMPAVYQGFTIANHSMAHPWPARIPLDTWRQEVVDARAILQDVFQQPILGFAYPFGEFNDAVTEVVREAGHVYARTCEARTPCFPPADPLRMPADCHHREPTFWDRYERAKVSGSVFYFWGHSFEFTNEEQWSAFDATLGRIAADPEVRFAELTELFGF
jgi:peptidoglycan/xylan/chitin deacetylase (PgdA/CDA1 family)